MSTSMDLREIVLLHGKNLLENPAVALYAEQNKSSEYYSDAMAKYNKLKNFEFSVAVAAEQSAGKTSILNTLIGFPLLPVCSRPATCVPAIIKYSENIRIEVEIENGEKTAIPTSLNNEVFKLCLDYFYQCITLVGLENPLYFLSKPRSSYPNMIPELKDLQIDAGNIKHVAMIVLNVLCLFMDQHREEKDLDSRQIEMLKMRKTIFSKFGIKSDNDNYGVIIHWNAPILKSGLVFHDFPGLGASVKDKNGENVHEAITRKALNKTQSMLYVFKPEVTQAGQNAIGEMLELRAIKDLIYKNSRFVPVINKVDQMKPHAVEDAIKRAADSFNNHGLHPEKVHKISTLEAEFNFVKIGGINPLSTERADERYNFIIIEGYEYDLEKESKNLYKQLENQYNEKSYYREFIEGLELTASRGIFIHTIEFAFSLYKLLKEAKFFFQNNIDISKDFIHSSLELWYISICFLIDPKNEYIDKISWKVDKSNIISIPVEFYNIMLETKKIVDNSFDQFVLPVNNTQVDFEVVFSEFTKIIYDEISTLQRDLRFIRDKMKPNILGHFVLYRQEGQEIQSENLKHWNKILSKTEDFNFYKSKNFYSAKLRKLVVDFKKVCEEIHEEVSRTNIEKVKEIICSFDEYYKNLLGKLSDEDRDVADKINGVFREALVTYQDEVTMSKYDIQDSDQEFINLVLSECEKTSEYLSKIAQEKFNRVKRHGIIFKKVGFLKKKELDDLINNINVGDSTIEQLEANIKPDDYIFRITREAREYYKNSQGIPAVNLYDKIKILKTIIEKEINKKGISNEELKHFIGFLDNLKAETIKEGLIMDNALSECGSEKWAENEILNLRGVRFENIFGKTD